MILKRYIHIKTVPKLYCSNLETLKSPISVPTHALLTKLNLIDHPKSGLVNWLPTGILILNKLKQIIRKRMDECGFEEVGLTLLSGSSLWKKTNRWNNSEIFKLKDSSDSEYCLVPTAEEEITNLVSHQITSYKNLPLLYYQINSKFRDEKRPRSGLLRGKEFIMKDAYSFDLSEKDAMKTYENVTSAYYKIFGDLKLPFARADADTGEIGGTLSHEWHYVHPSGEDTLFTCKSCGQTSNVEKALSFPEDPEDSKEVSVKYYMTKDKSTLVCSYYPSNREFQPNFIKNEIPDIDLSFENEEAILEEFSNEETLITKKIIRLMDARLTSRSHFPDFPIKFISRSLITTLTEVPLVSAIEGEICGNCEDGTLSATKAIEVGHTFFLGSKYTKPLDCHVEIFDSNGVSEKKDITMGCYGIGLSRIIASIGEIKKDERGLNWPSIIAPWSMTIIESPSIENTPSEFFQLLNENNIDYRFDNRQKIGLGKKIKHSSLMGIPLAVILGKQYPIIEIEVRGNRYNEELSWKKYYESKSFYWEVEYDKSGNDIKHYVHIDGFVDVTNFLLRDM